MTEAKPFRIGIWGTGRAGKTTYLAALYYDYRRQHARFDIEAITEESRHFIQSAYEWIFEKHGFPEKTVQSQEYHYVVTDKKYRTTFEMRFFDTAGEQFENFIYTDRRDKHVEVQQSTTAPLKSSHTPQQVFEHMLDCDGLIILIDPAWSQRLTQQRPLHTLLHDYFSHLKTERRRRDLPEPVTALVLSKVDGKDDTWHKRNGADDPSDCFRREKGRSVEECEQKCPVFGFLGYKFMVEHLPGLLSPDNISCFAISSIGRKKGTLNVGISSSWERSQTPRPDYYQPERGENGHYVYLHQPLRNAPIQETYEPSSIDDVNGITSLNLHQPIEWIRARLNLSTTDCSDAD